MAYMMMIGGCIGCNRIFCFNPVRVPSVRINGERQPVCQVCVDVANPQRIANGLDPIVVHPDAYGAEPDGNDDLYAAINDD